MSFEFHETLIRVALLGLTYFTVYLVIERLLAVVFRRRADELSLNQLIGRWRRTGRIVPVSSPGRLGWLHRLLNEAGADARALWRLCDRERSEIDRFDGTFPFISSIGMAMGLLGNFMALKRNAASGATPAEVIGLGINTTIWGMLLALIATFFDWLLRQYVPRLRFQTDVALEALEEILSPTASTAPAAKPARRPVDGDVHPQRSNGDVYSGPSAPVYRFPIRGRAIRKPNLNQKPDQVPGGRDNDETA